MASVRSIATLGLAMTVPTFPSRAESNEPVPRMTVSASAEEKVVPDVADIHLRVVVERPTSSAAAEEMAKLSEAVVAEVRAAGIESVDLRSTPSVTPLYEDRLRGPEVGRRVLKGYLAQNVMVVTVRDLPAAGKVARSLLDKGADVLTGMDYRVTPDDARTDALKVRAIEAAVRKASVYADAAKVRLVRILDVRPEGETGLMEDQARAQVPMMAMAAQAQGAPSTSYPTEPGQRTVRATVSMTWEIGAR